MKLTTAIDQEMEGGDVGFHRHHHVAGFDGHQLQDQIQEHDDQEIIDD